VFFTTLAQNKQLRSSCLAGRQARKAMPYTLSHAVISLPVSALVQRKIQLSALVVGSISPDLPYLLALTPTEAPGHSLFGVLTYCLVPSLFALFVWYRWLEEPTLDLLRLPKRAQSFGMWPFLLIVFGVLMGAYSHVLWDATSHSIGAFVINSEFWQREYFSLPLYKWNQYGSGVFGLMGLAVWYLHTVAKNDQGRYKGKPALGFTIYVACITFFVVIANAIHGSSAMSEYAVRSAIAVITGGVVGMCIYALVVNHENRAKIA